MFSIWSLFCLTISWKRILTLKCMMFRASVYIDVASTCFVWKSCSMFSTYDVFYITISAFSFKISILRRNKLVINPDSSNKRRESWERNLRKRVEKQSEASGKREENEKCAEFNRARGKSSVSALRWACTRRTFGSLERIKAELFTYRRISLHLTRTLAMGTTNFHPFFFRTKQNDTENNRPCYSQCY